MVRKWVLVLLAVCTLQRGRRVIALAAAPPQHAALAGCVGLLMLAMVEASLLRQWVWFVGTLLCALLHADLAQDETGKNR